LNKDRLSAEKLAESLLANGSTDFWSEIRKIRGNKTPVPSTVDGAQSDPDIGEVFSSKFRCLYNSVSYKAEDMDSLKRDMDESIRGTCSNGTCTARHTFSAADVKSAIGHLKPNKSDGNVGHSTDHLIHGTHRLHVLLALLFSSMVSHGFSPRDLLLS
jgi:hypothetical protein